MAIPTVGQATVARIGYGSTLSYAAPGGSPTWNAVAEVQDIKMPKHIADTIKIQRYDSPTLFAELIGGWLEAGEVEFSVTYNPAAGGPLFALLGQAQQFKIVKPDTYYWTYQAIVTEFGEPIPLKDKMMIDIKFKISGAPVPSGSSGVYAMHYQPFKSPKTIETSTGYASNPAAGK
jgi:hypothetical protein